MARRDRPRDEWQFLKNVGSNYELDLITSILAREGILVMKKNQGSGAYTDIFMGASLTGYDIYVPGKRLQQAHEILDNMPVFTAEEIDFNAPPDNDPIPLELLDEIDPGDGFILRHRNLFKKLLFIFIIVPALLGLAIGLFNNLYPLLP